MGCTVGRQTVLQGKCEKQLGKNLTPRQVVLVKETWSIVSENLADAGVVVFKRLLTRYPELCKLFAKFMTLRENGTYDWDLGGLQRHALLVMEALDAAVENLDNSAVLAAILFELGRKHGRLNVQEEMFDKLWEALRYGLGEILESRMTREVTAAWFQVYKYVARQMISGMRDYRSNHAKVEPTLSNQSTTNHSIGDDVSGADSANSGLRQAPRHSIDY